MFQTPASEHLKSPCRNPRKSPAIIARPGETQLTLDCSCSLREGSPSTGDSHEGILVSKQVDEPVTPPSSISLTLGIGAQEASLYSQKGKGKGTTLVTTSSSPGDRRSSTLPTIPSSRTALPHSSSAPTSTSLPMWKEDSAEHSSPTESLMSLPTPPHTPSSSSCRSPEEAPSRFLYTLSTIPNEILSLIFEWGARYTPNAGLIVPRSPFLPIQPSSDVPLQETISQVCRLWRDLAIHTPGLWTTIYVPLAEPTLGPTNSTDPDSVERYFKRTQKRLRTYLARSQSLPLDIILYCTKPRSWIWTDSLITQLTQHSWRWRSLCIIVPQYGPILTSVLCQLRDLQAPKLRRLQITSNKYPAEGGVSSNTNNVNGPVGNHTVNATFHGHPPLPTFLQGAHESLRHVILDRIQFSWSAPFRPLANLSSLELRFVIWPKYNHFRDLFAASPYLSTLIIHIDHAAFSFLSLHSSMTGDNGKPPILLPALEKLVVRSHMDKEYVRPFLRLFSMPALEELGLIDICALTWCQLLLHFRSPHPNSTTGSSTGATSPSTMSTNPYPFLKRLNLVGINHLINIDSSAPLAFPHLTHLSLTSVYSSAFLELLTETEVKLVDGYSKSKTVPIWPGLNELRIRSDPWLLKHQELLGRVLERRQELRVGLDVDMADREVGIGKSLEVWKERVDVNREGVDPYDLED
ncbi:hypothetical protein BDN72DRAFT_834876 [Pluteus cervinus]|uniref:Uncharacterized protein n=1 Tax=Pluteus cervinus TaxID=181527 RepID=A0ACD3B6D5_9AGAR|nr:hypothetical protein BDN72DRAFT_834876 [Pluteus cervinus]